MTGDHRPLLWPCIAESDEELRADEWLMDLEGTKSVFPPYTFHMVHVCLPNFS
jgi:hypothetical protein